MQPSPEHLKILKDIAVFSRVHRYHGMLPRKLAMFYDDAAIEDLLREEHIERVHFNYPCGSESVLLRLTESGQRLLAESRDALDAMGESPMEELTPQQWNLLSDIYHTSQLRKYGGIMPLGKIEDEKLSPKEVNQLYARGYLIRVKAEMGSGKKRKGFLISNKGLRTLNLGGAS